MKHIEITEQILKIKKDKETVFVSICGGADTGKSTMAMIISNELKKHKINNDFVCTDSFMIDRADRIRLDITGYNLKSLNQLELLSMTNDIQQKRIIKYFSYDSRKGKNLSDFRILKNINILIVEGIHSLNEIIRNKIDLKIFIDSNDKTLRTLRYNANINKRGFTEYDAKKRIDKEMEEYYYFVEPNKKYADIIINVDEHYNYQ